MTRIDFHSNVTNKLAYACRLVRKARAAQCQIVLLGRNRSELNQLDQLLWTFSEQDFLPHVHASDVLATQTPVILCDNENLELPHHHVLINLSGNLPQNFARFERMLEIISADQADQAAGRDRYRFYKQRGYPITHVVAN